MDRFRGDLDLRDDLRFEAGDLERLSDGMFPINGPRTGERLMLLDPIFALARLRFGDLDLLPFRFAAANANEPAAGGDLLRFTATGDLLALSRFASGDLLALARCGGSTAAAAGGDLLCSSFGDGDLLAARGGDGDLLRCFGGDLLRCFGGDDLLQFLFAGDLLRLRFAGDLLLRLRLTGDSLRLRLVGDLLRLRFDGGGDLLLLRADLDFGFGFRLFGSSLSSSLLLFEGVR